MRCRSNDRYLPECIVPTVSMAEVMFLFGVAFVAKVLET